MGSEAVGSEAVDSEKVAQDMAVNPFIIHSFIHSFTHSLLPSFPLDSTLAAFPLWLSPLTLSPPPQNVTELACTH